MKKKGTKDYTNRFKTEHEKFLLKRLQKEWQEAERAAKKHQLIKRAEKGALEFGRDLLLILAIGGMATVLLVAPKVFVAVDHLNRYRRFFKDVNTDKEIRTYSSKGYVNYRKIDEITYRVEITEKGKKLLLRSEAEKMRIRKTKSWDGIWRIVIFDIARKHNRMRDAFRDRLKKIGMYQLQESVFVCPYPCEEEIDFWAPLYFASPYIQIIRATEISDHQKLKDFFDLV